MVCHFLGPLPCAGGVRDMSDETVEDRRDEMWDLTVCASARRAGSGSLVIAAGAAGSVVCSSRWGVRTRV